MGIARAAAMGGAAAEAAAAMTAAAAAMTAAPTRAPPSRRRLRGWWSSYPEGRQLPAAAGPTRKLQSPHPHPAAGPPWAMPGTNDARAGREARERTSRAVSCTLSASPGRTDLASLSTSALPRVDRLARIALASSSCSSPSAPPPPCSTFFKRLRMTPGLGPQATQWRAS